MNLARLIATVAISFTFLSLAAPASATTDDFPIAPEVEYALAVEPGGVALDYWTAAWPDGMRLDVERDVVLFKSVGACPDGRVCVFTKHNAAGTKLSWSGCGTHSTSALGGPVASIANARSSGTLKALNGSTIVASAAAGTSKNVYATVTKVSC